MEKAYPEGQQSEKPKPRRKAAEKPATRARRGAVTDTAEAPPADDIVDEALAEAEATETTTEQKPTRSRRRRAG
jgi:hypothetical protein